MTKVVDRERARELRAQDFSLSEIASQLGVAKSSISVWVRDVKTTRSTEERNVENLEKALAVVRSNRVERWAAYHAEARKEWPKLSRQRDFMLGLGLYIGEGSKSSSKDASISNCDPCVHIAFLRFLKLVGITKDQIVFKIQAHEPSPEILKWWAKTIELGQNQIQMNQVKASKASKLKRKLQVRGTGTLRVRKGTELRQKLEVWMRLALAT